VSQRLGEFAPAATTPTLNSPGGAIKFLRSRVHGVSLDIYQNNGLSLVLRQLSESGRDFNPVLAFGNGITRFYYFAAVVLVVVGQGRGGAYRLTPQSIQTGIDYNSV
jgi:hypothetical protein